MTYLFSRANQDLLGVFACSNVLLALDFDGTLAPLVARRARAAMRTSTRRLLRHASTLYPCVVISGRAQGDVLARLHGVDVCRVIGNHGAEPSPDAKPLRQRVRKWLPSLRAQLSPRRGVVIEDKGFSVAVHYRRAREKGEARRAILAAVRSLDDARIVGGKLVVNLLVPEAPHKGLAVERERARLGCDTVVYLGDDETDEDVFRLGRRGSLLSVRVGRNRTSMASHYIRNQAGIDKFLRTFAALRSCRRV